MTARPALFILGTRGVPAAHGGFETFAQRFALHMVERGWDVTVYCQAEAGPDGPVEDVWNGVRRVTFRAASGALATIGFDWMCVRHAMRQRGVMLVLGYNTALFSAVLRLTGNPLITNMDGIEWKRAKWSWPARAWLYCNEWIGALTSTVLIADHPEIAKHLTRRRRAEDIVMIPYGADAVAEAPEAPVRALGLTPGRYLISIGRIEPENNILTMVRAFANRPRDLQFICLGKLDPKRSPYHAEVLRAGEGRVLFPGAIYDADIVKALRFHAAAYCHGHSVGGTNPSLVEALGAGNAIIAHDNPYNRWVAGYGQFYFGDAAACEAIFTRIEDTAAIIKTAHSHATRQFAEHFTWVPVLTGYEVLCQQRLQHDAVGAAMEPYSSIRIQHGVASVSRGEP
jgi:glycosyltransferase involved in cell wall biosynthesis